MPSHIADFEPLLAVLARDAEAYFGDGHARIEPVSRVMRPFSDLLRLRITVGTRQSHAFVKMYRPRRPRPYEPSIEPRAAVIAEFEVTRALHDAGGASTGIMAPRPIAVFPDALAIVTEEVDGVSLDRLLGRSWWLGAVGADLVAIAGRVGTWVRTYQRIAGVRGALSLDDQRAYLDDRLRYLTPRVIAAQERARALGLFDDLAALVAVPTAPLVAVHADLCPSNILVAPSGEVTVLDFATASYGTRFHDVAHLFMHLDFRGLGPARWRSRGPAMQAALLHGFDPAASFADPLFRLMLLQHIVCHVTWLVDEGEGLRGAGWLWLARLRWRRGLALPLLRGPGGAARPGTPLPVHPRRLPLH